MIEGTVLAGAGLSVAPPSNVPSWWGFNEEVLHRIVSKVRTELDLDADLDNEINDLSLGEIGVAHFSQIIHDSFAGQGWFQLLQVLEGRAPNDGHLALAELMRIGSVACVLTTNFDTLIEQALGQLGVDYDLLVPGRDDPPAPTRKLTRPLVVKLHGTVDAYATLVDLARQKMSGFSAEWKTWLRRRFEAAPISVIGFSGRDLELAPDYLGLFAAADVIPSLTWFSRDGTTDVPMVERLLLLCAHRGRLLAGPLPSLLTDAAPTAPHAGVTKGPDPRKTIGNWFDGPDPQPLACAVAVTRLLSAVGRDAQASALRAAVRTHVDKRYPTATFVETLTLSLVFSQFGADEIHLDPARARLDLGIALRLQDAIDETHKDWSPEASGERTANRTAVLGNLAMVAIALEDLTLARGALSTMLPLLELLPDDRVARQRRGLSLMVEGNLSAVSGDWRSSAIAFRNASDLFDSISDSTSTSYALAGWAQALGFLGELAVAATLTPHPLGPSSPVGLEALLERAEAEWGNAYGRFDEVWFEVQATAELDRTFGVEKVVATCRTLLERPAGAISSRVLVAGSLVAHVGPTSEIPFPGSSPEDSDTRRILIHPSLLASIDWLATDQGNSGIEQFTHSGGADATRALAHFSLAARAFEMVGRTEDALQTRIYCVDCLRANRDPRAASELASRLVKLAPPRLLPAAMERLIALIAEEAVDGHNRIEVEAVEKRVSDLRANMPDGGPDAAMAARDHALLLKAMGRLDESQIVFDQAVDMATGTVDEADLRTLRDTLFPSAE